MRLNRPLLPPEPPAPPDAPPSAPPSTRTLFAITLQISRCFPALVALVHAGYLGHVAEAQSAARRIATGIVRGARDRSRDPHPRTLHDQQRRTQPLTRKRRRPKRAPHSGPPKRSRDKAPL